MNMRFSEHFEEDRREQPDRERITLPMCERAVGNPVESSTGRKGRTIYWGYVEEEDRYLKVIVEPDGEEIVTAHFDRAFKREVKRRQG